VPLGNFGSQTTPQAPDQHDHHGTCPQNRISCGTPVDPQRVNVPVDRALLGDFVHRTLVRYAQDTDSAAQSSVVPDLASDTGTPSSDYTTWSFTLRDDVRWADGAPIVCEDIKYGVSRQFARESLVGGIGVAVDLLDIPTGPDGKSVYEGPYSRKGVQHFDRAVSCEGRRIVFSLAAPVADFPEALTHVEFSPVRPDRDTGDRYELEPLPSGPYEIREYTPGRLLVLRRSATWQPSTDPLRPAHPDEVVVSLSLPPEEIARRVVADSGNDRFAVVADDAGMAAVAGSAFDDPERSWREPTQAVTYLSVNSRRLPLVEHRRAIIAATDRVAAAAALGANGAGDPADGLIAPGLALDYAPTGLEDGLIGEPLAATGDAALARRLLAESGRDLPKLIVDYPEIDVAVAQIEAVVTSLTAAGIAVEPNPLAPSDYYPYVLDPQRRGHLSWLPWRPDWANATRVVPPLFGAGEPFNLSGVNEHGGVEDEDLAGAIEAARTEADRQDQAAAMQAANARIVELGLAVPLGFGEDRRMWGSGLMNVFYHAPVGAYAFAQIVPGPS
jgi:peptide/nickel transport system substrate-binding protein